MATFAFFLIFILVIAGLLGFAFAKTVTHIVKFAFFIIFVLLLVIVLYAYLTVHAPPVQTPAPVTPNTEVPAPANNP